MKDKHPMQPICLDKYGVARFKVNPIVRYLLDAGPYDMNFIAALPNTSADDHSQFAQLIGYSVDGYADLSYSRKEWVKKADKKVEKLVARRKDNGNAKNKT